MGGYSLFVYQDENEDENQSFRSFLYVLKQACDERTRDLPGNALVITFFIHSDFSVKLQQIRMQCILQRTANNAKLQTQIASYLLL